MGGLLSSTFNAASWAPPMYAFHVHEGDKPGMRAGVAEDQHIVGYIEQTCANTNMNRSSRTVDEVLAEMHHNESTFCSEICIVNLGESYEGSFSPSPSVSSISSNASVRKRLEFAEADEILEYEVDSPCTAMSANAVYNTSENNVLDIRWLM